MRFRILGFPVSVLPGYWLLSAMLGLMMGDRSPLLVVVMMGIVFASILVHELGHALAARAFGLPAQITLHMMGGATSFPRGAALTRGRDILISLAGPGMGLALGVVCFGLLQVYASPETFQEPSEGAAGPSHFVKALIALAWINVVWSVLNLVPVVPFDGGRVLVAALGPERLRSAAIVSLVVGLGAAVIFYDMGWLFPAVLFGSAALSSFFRMRQALVQDTGPAPDQRALEQIVSSAERALEQNQLEQASMLAHSVMTASRDVATASRDGELMRRALRVFLWARLGAGDAETARTVLASAPAGAVDPYLSAAVHEATGHLDDAQRALSEARANGDQRVEVTALLIKVLLEQKKFPTAANLAREIVSKSRPDDVRRVAREASTGGAHAEAARLSLALAKEERSFADAEQALYGFASAGAEQEAVEAFTLANGFDQAASKRLLNDERVRPIRSALEAAL